MQQDDRIFINPGSCGLPMDGCEEGAPYTLLNSDENGLQVQERRVPYDIEAFIRKIEESDQFERVPVWSKIRIKELRSRSEHLYFSLNMLRNMQSAQAKQCGPSGRKRGKVHSKNGTDSERKTVLILSPGKVDIQVSIPAYIVKTSFRGNSVKDYIEERAIDIANYIIDYNATVRQTAKQFGISKSTVHKDVTERLSQINPALAKEARKVLDVNKSERHIRGGLATREKYLHQSQNGIK